MISKKLTYIFTFAVLTTFLLGACATAAPSETVATPAPVIESAPTEDTVPQVVSQPATVPAELNTTFENAVSIEQQLIFGALKLEGTNLAVSKEQAAILVPLYTNLKTIVESMMPAQGAQGDPASTQPQAVSAEIQAQVDTIIKDILTAMTPEQIKAISDMQITREIAQTIMTEKGISMGRHGQNGEMPGANGQPPEGTPPAGDQNRGAGVPQQDTPSGGMIQPELINSLLESLQAK
jgi:hypothetical protein